MLVKVLVTTIATVSVATTGAAAINANANANTHTNTSVAANSVGYEKDQCKDGGWQSLGFKNQGECVSYFVPETSMSGVEDDHEE